MNELLATSRQRDSAAARLDDRPRQPFQASDTAHAICRICRGEGTSTEPLFYPCKCSGSIKYVHQECLMEWLSHSQKKYCELCKTSFRFTKLYAPDMPQSLPVHVFLEHLAKYLVRNFLLWLRAIVTISVWVCWLPYFMRVVWAFMFWISDEGLGAGHFMSRQTSKPLEDSLLAVNGACAVRTIFDEAMFDYVDKITFLNTGNTSRSSRTLLSEVGLLKNLTRSSAVNRSFITVLEGQIITILVIVCFILVILVRDYVVQQQPEINIRAAFAEQGNNPVRVVRPEDEEVLVFDDDEDNDGEDVEEDNDGEDVEEDNDGEDVQDNDGEDVQDNDSHSSEYASGVRDAIPQVRNYPEGDAKRHDSSALSELPSMENQEDGTTDRSQADQDRVGHNQQAHVQAEDHDRVYPGTTTDDEKLVLLELAAGDNDDLTGESCKGKERQLHPEPAEVNEAQLPSGPSRPRSRSDGPVIHSSTHPLANNNWSFADLPNTADDEASTDLAFHVDALSHVEPTERMTLAENLQTSHNDDDVDRYEEHHAESMHATAEEPPPLAEPDRRGLVGHIANFMWGDLDHQGEDAQDPEVGPVGEQEVGDIAFAEDQWIDEPVARPVEANGEANAGVVDVAAGAGMDAEAMEELEDFEGVMELLGMRGPIAGLFQNAIFCAVLVSVTIFGCIFIPYNIGRVSLWITANPIHLVRIFMGLSKVIQDSATMVFGFASWCALNIVDMFTGLVGGAMGSQIVLARKASWGIWTSAGSRVVEYALMDLPSTASEVQSFSAISHEALYSVKGYIGWIIDQANMGLLAVLRPDFAAFVDGRFINWASNTGIIFGAASSRLLGVLIDPNAWVIDLGELGIKETMQPDLANWSGLDRFWAILSGYLTIFTVGALYLKRGSPLSRGDIMQAWEAGVIDTLHQASGIIKVILIISIEMLVFPLYCGLLLDGALLPLFEGTTFKSRILFTYNYPLTSVFVHWFVGTGYMFHFALFVSMCRKIMRPGVLYFIRDPDDPEFHPVRDVLERPLTTQLRKILFSAFVYGALVIVCLGGVVWGLCFAIPGVLPIHYSSNEPVLEFPVDLLFYNFLMPLAIKFFKPSDGLHAMYTWWFRKCARGLRLTYFLFGERRIDEEGTLYLEPALENQLPAHKSLLLELSEDNRVIPKTWKDTFEGGDAKPNPTMSRRELNELRMRKGELIETGQMVESGLFVRAPASDRVKIPKGQQVFLTVFEYGGRTDGKPDTDLYASDQYQLVYVPPSFRARIFLFILFIWLFAAVTGVGFTIVPLVIGRTMFQRLLPAYIRTNDIYAFSIGIYVLGSVAYATFRLGYIVTKFGDWARKTCTEIRDGNSSGRVFSVIVYGAKLAYAYFFLLVVFPLAVSTLMELYVSIPLHTYMNPPRQNQKEAARQSVVGDTGHHTVRVIQSWTLGLLYLNLTTRMITSLFPNTRAATAVRSIMRRGYLRPDVDVLTRAFVIPGVTLTLFAIFGPPLLADIMIKVGFIGPLGAAGDAKSTAQSAHLSLIYRHSYPAAAVAVILTKYAIGLTRVFNRWTAGVRDEAYLIGERLHNFGAATAGSRKARKAWGAAGGGRL